MKPIKLIALVIIGTLFAALMLWPYFPSSVDATTPASVATQVASRHNETSTRKEPSTAPARKGITKEASCTIWCKRLTGQTVGQYVKSLYGPANNGDKQAAYEIYRAESICALAPKIQQNMKEMSPANDPGLFTSFQSSVDEIKSVCADFNGNERERLNYLLIAVKGGVPKAAASFAFEPPEGIDNFHTDRIDLHDPRVTQWKNDAIGYLTQAAAQGDTGSMGLLSGFYANGQMTPQNLQMALTYTMALAEINNEHLDSPNITDLSGKLTPDQARAAKVAANQLVNSCCAKR